MPGPSVRLRLVPGEVCRSWGNPPQTFEHTARLAFPAALCSPIAIYRIRTRLKIKDKDPVNVSLRIEGQRAKRTTAAASSDESADSTEGGQETLDVSLLPWNELPNGHIVLLEPPKPPWSGWGSVR